MNLLNKLTIKNLKLNKKRTIVTIIGIMLSVALITAVTTIYVSGLKSLVTYEKLVKGNYHVEFLNVPLNDVTKIKNNLGVDKVFLTQEVGYAKINESKNVNKPYAYILAFDKDSLKNLSVSLIEGRLPENSDEIVISNHLLSNGRVKLKVGEEITLDIGKRYIDNDKLDQSNPYNDSKEIIKDRYSKTYKIVGISKRPTSSIEPYTAPGYTFITLLSQPDKNKDVNVFALYNKAGSKQYSKVTANILEIDEKIYDNYLNGNFETEKEFDDILSEVNKAKYNVNLNQYLIMLENNPIKSSGLNGLIYVVYIVCIIIVITSVFCIKNSFDISITEKTKQYGMLRSIGATKKQIKKNVFYEATILGLIGIPLGLLLGFVASYILILITNYLLADAFTEGLKLVLSYSLVSYIFAIILGIITIYFSAFKSAHKASKVSPIESIRNSASISIKSQKLKTPKIINKLFGVGGEISFKNLKRNKKKYRVTVLSIIISVAVFIALTYFMNTFMASVNREISYTEYNLSYSISVSDKNNELISKILETTKLDNIKEYTMLRNISLEVINAKFNKEYMNLLADYESDNFINIIAVGNDQYEKFIKDNKLNYNDCKDKGILIDNVRFQLQNENKKTKKYDMRVFSYEKDDVINLEGNRVVSVAAVLNTRPFGLGNNYDSKYLLITDEYFDSSVKDNLYYQLFYDSNNSKKLGDDIDNILKGESYTINNYEDNIQVIKKMLVLIGIFLYGFIIVITLIGITNIFNTITTNMELRKPEFAMLKSVGMTKKEFNKMIRLESAFMCIKSLFYGISIGLIVSYIIYYVFGASEGLKFNIPFNGIIISCLFVFILISILMKYSINKINKQNTIETIRNENI